jgi:acetyl-CoA carboxylase alpha subunit
MKKDKKIMSKLALVDIFKKRTRNPFRPRSSDIVDMLFPDFEPIEGGSVSLMLGTCRFMDRNLFIIGQQKPKPSDLKKQEDLDKLNYGMFTSDDHSLILSVLKQAEESDPDRDIIFCLIDTYGADISMESAQHFQASLLPT